MSYLIRIFTLTVITLLALAIPAEPSGAAPSDTGQWSTTTTLPFFPVHSHLLPTGKVMVWPGDQGISGNDPRSWDPTTLSVSNLSLPGYDVFCAGHTFLADGKLFVAGGHIQNSVGLSKASTYDASTDRWTSLPNMNAGRWYPTATVLANDDVLVVSGDQDLTVGENTLPQVYQVATNTWRSLTNAQRYLDLYPRMLLAPNGRVFNAAPLVGTYYLDTAGSGTWTYVADRASGYTDYGSAVMYQPGKILVMGGGDPPTAQAEVIDLNVGSPSWRRVANMAYARRQTNAVLLPDGQVLVTGGTSGPGFNDANNPVFAAELWNPATEAWTTMASASTSYKRLYHSATILLPDGRVLSTGGNGYPQSEFYSPPYLFKGARPTITSAPNSVSYGQSFFVGTPDAASITKARLLRASSTTHAFNESQYINELSFSPTTGGLNVVAPRAPAGTTPPVVAPRGPYLLFLLNGNGVPSVGKFVQLGGAAPAQPLPDMIVTSVSYANGVFTSVVKNRGTAATPNGTLIGVGYLVDGVPRTWGTIGGPLAAGASATVGTNGGTYTIASGTHSVTAYVDDINRFPESNETNNQLTVTVGAPGGGTVTVTQPANQTSTVGTAASLQIAASANPAGTQTYGATGLPAGLSINAASGLISGTPTTAGTSNITVTVTSTNGGSGNTSFTWTVNAAGTSTNRALGRPASAYTASSVEGAQYPASAAFDGNATTRWSSQFANPQWVQVDLGATYNITAVRLAWEAAYATSYQIQVSANGTTWTNIYSTTQGTGGTVNPSVTGVGRYVRMYGTVRATPYGYSLWEFEVYGSPAGGGTVTVTQPANQTSTVGTAASLQINASANPAGTQTYSATGLPAGLSINAANGLISGTPTTAVASANVTVTVASTNGGSGNASFTWTVNAAGTSTNIALGKTATSSSPSTAGFQPALAVDGNSITRWGSAYSDPQWLQVDLGSTYNITGVKLVWEGAYAASYKIQVSTNGTAWTDLYSTTQGTGGTVTPSVTGVGRYVRMYGIARGTVYGYSLWEFEVYGAQ